MGSLLSMEFTMRNKILAIFVALSLSLSVSSPAKAWWYGGYGYGWGGYGAAIGITAGAAVLGGVIGAIASQPYYNYPYNPYYGVPVYNYPGYGYVPYAYPVATPVAVPTYRAPTVKKQIIIKNSPGATVYEEDDIFGW